MNPFLLRKAHIRAHDRKTPSGGTAWVMQHEDSRKAAVEEIGGKWMPTGQQVTTPGSFEGSFMSDPATNKSHYVKGGLDEDQVRVEHLANRLYRRAGVRVAPTRLVTQGGKLRVASETVVGGQKVNAEALPGHPDVHQGFGADAWLASWDVAGAGPDAKGFMGKHWGNLMRDPEGHVVRIDQGGALDHSGLGGKKKFGTDVSEITALLDKKMNPTAAHLFSKMEPADVIASLKSVTDISNADIEREVGDAGFTGERAKALIETLEWRREDLRQKGRKMERAMAAAASGKLPEPLKPDVIPEAEKVAPEATIDAPGITKNPPEGTNAPTKGTVDFAKMKAKFPEIIAAVREGDGGFTYNPGTGESPKSGYTVSIFPKNSAEIMHGGDVTPQDLIEFLQDNNDLFEESADHYFGGWRDPKEGGHVWLDVVVNKPDEAEVRALAIKHNQKSYWDVVKGVSVDVGGTGKAPGTDSPAGGENLPGTSESQKVAESATSQQADVAAKPKNWWSMAVDEHKALKIGSKGEARWTNNFRAKAEIVKLHNYPNGRTMKVRLLEDVKRPGYEDGKGGYPAGHIITLPTVVDLKGFTQNNRFAAAEGK
jgi:hypothetical protein